MALISCSECGREVSDKAAACPHCGAPVADMAPQPVNPPSPKENPLTKNRGCGTFLVFLFMVGALFYACSPKTDPGAGVASTRDYSPPPELSEEQKETNLRRDVSIMEDESQSAGARLGRAQQIAANHKGTPEGDRASALIPDLEETVRKENLGRQWNYVKNEDGMSGKQSSQATVHSTNLFELDFPYQGPQRARLTVRRHPRWGSDVIFSIERGQVLCSSYRCPVRVRFDDGSPRTLAGNEPSDHSSEVVFIPGYGDFVARMAKAKKVRIEVDIHKQGPLVAEFNVEGFDASRLK